MDLFDKELERTLNKDPIKKQTNKSHLQRIDTTIRQALTDFKLDQLATDAKEVSKAKDSTFEIWTITPLPISSSELYHALVNDSDMYEDDEPTQKQIQARTHKKLNKLFVESNGLATLLSKYDIAAHFIDSRYILPGSYAINFGPGDECDAPKVRID